MYGNNQYALNSLERLRDRINDTINNYQAVPQQAPVNNFINTNNVPANMYEVKKLNEKDEELAKEIVDNMKPLGEYWSMDTVASVIGNDNHKLTDMYVVMNSLINDYSNVISSDDTDTYVKMAHAWLDDEDAKKHKLWKYFVSD